MQCYPLTNFEIQKYFQNNVYLIALELNTFQKKLKKCRGNKNIMTNIYRIQASDSMIYGTFYIGFIDFILNDKSLLDCTN